MENHIRKVVFMILNEKELMEIEGGAKYSFIIAIGAIGTFIIGILDGILRPLKCNN